MNWDADGANMLVEYKCVPLDIHGGWQEEGDELGS
jgi:hypothetical protein